MTTATSAIDDRQRSPEGQRRLRAYTAEYRLAKHYRGGRHIGGVVLAAAGPIAALASVEAAGVVGIIASVWVIVTRMFVAPAEKRRVQSAVRLQEAFDSYVFQLEWPDYLAGPEVRDDDIVTAKQRVEKDTTLTAAIDEGWYHPTPEVPWPADVVLAQISSAAWSKRQHTAYAWVLIAFTCTAAVVATVVGIALDMKLTNWLVTFLLPSMPALLDSSELAQAHREMATERSDLEQRLCSLWSKAESGSPEAVTPEVCRINQDESYRLRAKGVQVPEWFYWRRRKAHEVIMREATDARVARFLAANGQHKTGPRSTVAQRQP